MKTFFVSLVVFLVTLAFVMPLVADEADANSPQTEVEAVEQGDSYVESIDPNSTSHGLGKYRSQLQQFNRAVMVYQGPRGLVSLVRAETGSSCR